MLRFYTAGESHGQALLAFISGLPAQMPIELKFINHELRRRQTWLWTRRTAKKSKRTRQTFLPECATARPLAHRLLSGLRIAIGPMGKNSCP